MSTPELISTSDVTVVAFEVTAGDRLQVDIPLTDRAGQAVVLDGSNVGDWSARAYVRRNTLTDRALYVFTTGGDSPNATLVQGQAGKVRLVATPADTIGWQDWPSRHLAVDVVATGPVDGSGPTETRLIATGTLQVRPRSDLDTVTLPEIPLLIRGGEPLDVTVPVLDADDDPVAAVSIVSARAQVRSSAPGGPLLHEWTTTGTTPNASVTSDGIRLQATEAQTLAWQTAWPARRPMWDLVVVDTTGATRRLCQPSPVHLDPVLTQ